MDPLNPIIPDRDPVIPTHLLPAIQRISPEQQRDDSQEQPGEQESEQEEESFEHVLEEVVDDDYPTLAEGHAGPSVISDAVVVSGKEPVAVAEATADDGWAEEIAPERRATDGGPDDEPPRPHIDITA